MLRIFHVGAIAVGLAVSSPSFAATFDFTNLSLGNVSDVVLPDVDGRTTVRVQSVLDFELAGLFGIVGTGRITSGSLGLGVDQGLLDGPQLDGFLGNDGLLFSFNGPDTLASAQFANVDRNDDLTVYANFGSGFTFIDRYNIGTDDNEVLFSSLVGIQQVLFLAEDARDNFRVAGLVTTPLPAAGVLFGSVLAAAWMRRYWSLGSVKA